MTAIKLFIKYKVYPGNPVATDLSKRLAVGQGRISVPVGLAIGFLGTIAISRLMIGHTASNAVIAAFCTVIALAICSIVLFELHRTDTYQANIARALGQDPSAFHQNKFPKALKICGAIVGTLAALTIILAVIYGIRFGKANSAMNAGDYQTATLTYESLDTDEAKEKAADARYQWGLQLMDNGDYQSALDVLNEIPSRYSKRDVKEAMANIKNGLLYEKAKEQLVSGEYDLAIDNLRMLAKSKYADTEALLNDAMYRKALSLIDAGRYDSAIVHLKELENYKDSEKLLEECVCKYASILIEEEKYDSASHLMADFETNDSISELKKQCDYQRALKFAQDEDYLAAYDLLLNLPSDDSRYVQLMEDYGNYFQIVHDNRELIGTSVYLGNYENSTGSVRPIEWRVLNIPAMNTALVISVDIVDMQPYDTDSNASIITWDSCSLRTWLNGSFLETAFTESERDRISDTERHTEAGKVTIDKIFLLTGNELKEYLYNNASAMPSIRSLSNEPAWWACNPSGEMLYVSTRGRLTRSSKEISRFSDYLGVRPAMIINLAEESNDP